MSAWVLIWLLALACALIAWRAGRDASEAASKAAKAACLTEGVQFLDFTVAFKRFLFKRGVLRRLYSFDYCPNGHERFRGQVLMRGRRVETVAFDASTHPNIIA
jgi:Protein of unknown function (DUF3301)